MFHSIFLLHSELEPDEELLIHTIKPKHCITINSEDKINHPSMNVLRITNTEGKQCLVQLDKIVSVTTRSRFI